MQLIESYSYVAGPLLTLCGRQVVAPALYEGDDGIRFLVVSSLDEVPAGIWVSAYASGARALFAPGPSGALGVSAERFMVHRTENPLAGVMAISHCAVDVQELHYVSLRQAEERPVRLKGFVHLHAHSEHSALDGLSKVSEMVDEVNADHQGALALTDHGVCAGHPALQRECDRLGLKPIFGIEANFTDNRFARGEQVPVLDERGQPMLRPDGTPQTASNSRTVLADYRHLVLWAQNNTGLRNLWAMSTEANRDGFYGRPRMDWDTLARHSEGVIGSSACLRGPLSRLLAMEDEEGARMALSRLLAIYGDRFYIELHTNALPEQRVVNERLIELATAYGVPMIASVDSHYPCHEHHEAHKVWIAAQTSKDLTDDADLFAGDNDYYLLPEAKVREALSYLPASVVDEAVTNTVAVAERCDAKIVGKTVTPVYSRASSRAEAIEADKQRLIDVAMSAWERKCTGRKHSQAKYLERFEREMHQLIDSEFCGYYLIVWDYVSWAKRNGILVGPGRGSGAGSLVAYLCGITEVDPIHADLLFERFLTPGRKSPPDFDVDFPASKRDMIQDYIVSRWGEDYVMRVGTHLRYQNKGVIKALARALRNTIDIHWPDIEQISKIIDRAEAGSAGLGIKWEDLWSQHGEELEPYRAKYPKLFELADLLVGRLQSYGRHAAGLVISTDDEPLTDRYPMRASEDGTSMISEFAMDDLEALGLLKFDILTIRNLDTVQECVDLVRISVSHVVDVYSWGPEEMADPYVWDELSEGHTVGVFQVETSAGTRLTRRFRPQSMDDLSDVITLVRPGPVRSGLTETYFRRRQGLEPVSFPHPDMADVLGTTNGCILYQEQVMAACSIIAGYNMVEADEVRKILGKKKVEAAIAEGSRFVSRSVARGVSQAVAEALWDELVEFSRYSFNRSHSWSYALIGWWTAWLKFHYPRQFLVAALSTVDKERIPQFIQEARRMEYSVLPPDINVSGIGFSMDGLNIRYGLDSVKGVGTASAQAIIDGQPYASWEDYIERKPVNIGVTRTLAAVGAFDSLVPNRRALESMLDYQNSDECGVCQWKQLGAYGPNGLPCSFNWLDEPVVLGKTGRPLKAKPLPARCTKACRQYTPRSDPDWSDVAPYTEADIRDIEREHLGVWLSSTPFDRLDPADMEVLASAEEVMNGPTGTYFVAVIPDRIRSSMDSRGREMAFTTLMTQDGQLEAVVFSSTWDKYKRDLHVGSLGLAEIEKNNRGCALKAYMPC